MIELGPAGYLVVLGSCAASFVAGAVEAQRRMGSAGLSATTIISMAVFVVLGYLDWRRITSNETPLVAYIMTAVVPTGGSALLIYLARRRSLPEQLSVGIVSFVVLVFPALVVGTYFLSAVFPF